MLKKLAVSTAALAAMTGSALAADIMYTPPPAPPPAPVLFDWSGPYAGVFGGIFLGTAFEAGAQVGYNFVPGALFGIEGSVAVAFGTAIVGEVTGRVGAIVGAEDRGLIYAEAGLAFVGGLTWTAGGGVEFAVGDSVSLFVESNIIGGTAIEVAGGVNFHFGN